MSAPPYLPFARPTLDEATIAGVADVLRSGWITSGPWVQAFEAALSAFCGGRPVRVAVLGHRRAGGRAAACRHRSRRRGDHAGADVLRGAQHDRQGRRDAGVRRRRPRHAQHRPRRGRRRAITPRTRAIMPTHFAGLPVDMDALYALAARARPARDRGRGAGDRLVVARAPHRQLRRHLRRFSFHPNKNMTTIEGGALVVQRRARGRARRGAALPRHRAAARRHARRRRSPAASSTCPTSTRAIGLAQLARLPTFNAAPRARSSRATSRASRPTRRACCRTAATPATRPATAGTCSRRCCRSTALTLSRKAFRDALEARGIGTGVSYEARAPRDARTAASATSDGDLPEHRAHRRETVTLPLFPAMTDADVDRVCADLRRGASAAHRR